MILRPSKLGWPVISFVVLACTASVTIVGVVGRIPGPESTDGKTVVEVGQPGGVQARPHDPAREAQMLDPALGLRPQDLTRIPEDQRTVYTVEVRDEAEALAATSQRGFETLGSLRREPAELERARTTRRFAEERAEAARLLR